MVDVTVVPGLIAGIRAGKEAIVDDSASTSYGCDRH